jgi:hypothetical protein
MQRRHAVTVIRYHADKSHAKRLPPESSSTYRRRAVIVADQECYGNEGQKATTVVRK